jgi:hypothetical protein
MAPVQSPRRWIALLLMVLTMLTAGLACSALFASTAAWSIGGWDYVKAVWAGARIERDGVYYSGLAGFILGSSIAMGCCRVWFAKELHEEDGA